CPTIAFTLTPKAGAFFAFAISVQNFALAKSSLALGAGDAYVRQSFPKKGLTYNVMRYILALS
ncbi:MAG: hypothetical protein U9N58_04275, partial [Thermodesulfobacteriota bacterium]|nr:hypothetical protein [Thermodesulfobacteriota bacterium]